MATTARSLNILGLVLTLIGAALLFFYGMPRKHLGNVIFQGGTAMKFDAKPGERDVPDAEWQAAFDKFTWQTSWLNRLGFALVTGGTALQLAAAW